MFSTVLVANRGEIACRIIRTLRSLGIRSIAVHSDEDAAASHVALADAAVRIGGARSYLDSAAVVAAAVASGADAVHPGYGFLSENADFASACAAAGIVFVGPSALAIETMGDKIRARHHVAARGVPVVPGGGAEGMSDDELAGVASEIGYPLLIKPSAGGGGKGMTIVSGAHELADGLATARRVALASFGSEVLLLERYLATPRHIEVQVLADQHGAVVHLGERECSLQRRHQKLVEEAPSPLVSPTLRERMGDAAREVARSVDYAGAGTVEFLVSNDAPDEFFFMEMNTRLQVEHPVTELVTGIDLVAWQLRVAAGQALGFSQSDIVLDGHAIEARLYAEDPSAGFLPATGTVLLQSEATGPGIRVDSALVEGLHIGTTYDPMLAKIIAHGSTRGEALGRLRAALDETVLLGVRSNLEFLRRVLADERVERGELDTGLIARIVDDWTPASATPQDLAIAALVAGRPSLPPPWDRAPGWRLGQHASTRTSVRESLERSTEVLVGSGGISVGGVPQEQVALGGLGDGKLGAGKLSDGPYALRVGATTEHAHLALDGCTVWLAREGRIVDLLVESREQELAVHRASRTRAVGSASPEVRSPMPGTVVAVAVASGSTVQEGDLLLTIEAMKMEHRLLAPLAGIVTIDAALGALVSLDEVVARMAPAPHTTNTTTSSTSTTHDDPHEGAARD